MFGPKRKPDSNKYILWKDSVHLTDPSCYLHDPFNFDSHSDVITPNQHVALTHWESLFTLCNTLGTVPPILSTLTDVKVSAKKRKLQTLSFPLHRNHANKPCTHERVLWQLHFRLTVQLRDRLEGLKIKIVVLKGTYR